MAHLTHAVCDEGAQPPSEGALVTHSSGGQRWSIPANAAASPKKAITSLCLFDRPSRARSPSRISVRASSVRKVRGKPTGNTVSLWLRMSSPLRSPIDNEGARGSPQTNLEDAKGDR